MRIGALLGITAGLAACAESPIAPRPLAPAAAAAEVSAETMTLPFNRTLFIPCANGGAGEKVTLVGLVELQTRTTESEDGGMHVHTHARPSQIIGAGHTTGAVYRGVGATSEHEAFLAGGEEKRYTFVSMMRFVGQGPGNNLSMHVVVHQAWNDAGELVADVDLNAQSCK